MQDLLAACVELETLAVDVYAHLAESADDPHLAEVFRQMSADETEHIVWWEELRASVGDEQLSAAESKSHMTAYVRAIVATLRMLLETEAGVRSDDDRLALAASLEFYAIDPVFADIILQKSGQLGAERNSAYARHLDLLIDTMQARHSWALSPHIALLRAVHGEGHDLRADAFEQHDGVTGLPLRVVADTALAELCTDPARHGQYISVVAMSLIGLDELAEADPAVSERALQRVVSAITSLLRLTDLLVRVDGFKLLAIMPGTSRAAACATAEQICESVRRLRPWADGSQADALSVASGVLTIMPSTDLHCDPESAFAAAQELADEALAAGACARSVTLSTGSLSE
jgi:GGDEF domain-containing protein